MSQLLPISIVIVTLAFVALVGTAIVAMIRIGRRATLMADAVHRALEQLERTVHEANALLVTVRELSPSAIAVAKSFHEIGARAAGLSAAVLDEVEAPVLNAAALARGVRAGAMHLLSALSRRWQQQHLSNPQEQPNE